MTQLVSKSYVDFTDNQYTVTKKTQTLFRVKTCEAAYIALSEYMAVLQDRTYEGNCDTYYG